MAEVSSKRYLENLAIGLSLRDGPLFPFDLLSFHFPTSELALFVERNRYHCHAKFESIPYIQGK
jgi:hypothetical protein